jgi:hypothetical protein
LLSSGFSKVVSNGAYPIAGKGQVSFTQDWRGIALSLQNRENFPFRYAAHHGTHRRVAHPLVRLDGRTQTVSPCRPSLAHSTIPFANDVPSNVAQDGKRQRESDAQTFGFCGCIDGNCDDGSPSVEI